MLIFVRTYDGDDVAVRMPEGFLSEATVDGFNKHMNTLRAMFPGNINYFYLPDDPDRKFHI